MASDTTVDSSLTVEWKTLDKMDAGTRPSRARGRRGRIATALLLVLVSFPTAAVHGMGTSRRRASTRAL